MPRRTAPATSPWLGIASLCLRELVRFFRQRNRVIGALGQPILFWILFGFGFGSSFRIQPAGGDQVSYFQYYFPGTLALILLFTAIFTTISIIEDRREGFLQSVLVAPLPRWAMVLGKVLGGSLIAVGQGVLFLLLGLTIDLPFSVPQLVAVTAFMLLVASGLTALGFFFAWRLDSSQGYHAIMSVLLFPMWLLSGAFFPAGDNWLGWVMLANPFTYAVAGLRRLLYWQLSDQAAAVNALPSFTVCLVVTVAFTGICFCFAWRSALRTTKGDLLS
ncbi:MAG: ABC transporter permease [Planctomycetales bacterium]|nr:ABC transporter permease [Planctomycetales bacterium]